MKLLVASEEEKLDRDRLSHDAWGGGLDPDQYLAREARLRSHPWSRRALTTWLLVDEGGAQLASCETYRMESVLRGAGGATYGVASVYTEPALRGRGHATRMMDLLGGELARDPEAHAVILFSDVGGAIYARSGFVEQPAFDRVFSAQGGDPGVDQVFADLSEAYGLLQRPEAPFVVWPTAEQLDWHLERGRVSSALRDRGNVESVGARAGRSVAVWAGDFEKNQLLILRLEATDAVSAEALVHAAQRAAHESGFPEVRLWEAPLPFAWNDTFGARVPRKGGLPMIRPFVPELTAAAWTDIARGIWM
jgi:GNAT superfamily N-acetyltransferase